MTKKKTYVTIFPEFSNIHLKKDVGMIPYSLKKYQNYNTSIVCYKNEEFPIGIQDVEKYSIKFVNKLKNDIIDFSIYLFKNAKSIDILNIYHITSRRNLFWILVYRFRNPKGKVHLKLDADYRIMSQFEMYPKQFKKKLKNFLFRKFCFLITVESSDLANKLSKAWRMEVKLLPNGFYEENEGKHICLTNKENFFLTVGRLGTEQKATEILLEAFKNIYRKTSYNLILIGSIEKEFEKYIKKYFEDNPELKERVFFKGSISNFNELNEYYSKASVFVLPSRWESFGLVILEALKCGTYLILTDQIPIVDDVINKGKYGCSIPANDIDSLSCALLNASNKQITVEERSEMNKFVVDNYSWEKLSSKLNNYIKEN